MTLTAQKLLRFPFSKEVSHETVAQRPLAQPSRHFGPVASLSLWRGANFEIARAPCLRTLGVLDRSRAVPILMIKEILRKVLQASCQEVCYRDLAKRALIESLCGDLLNRIDLFQGACTEILPRGLLQRSCQESSYRELVQRACPGDLFYRDLVQSPLRDLLQGSCQGSSFRELLPRYHKEILPRDLL